MVIDLTLACGEYDLTYALHTGLVRPSGIDLNVLTYESPERHWRMMRHGEFDICEMSLGSYLASRKHPDLYPFTAITVFPHRRFRHSYMFKHSGISSTNPGDLEGKKIGLRTWQTTAGIWMRGIAQEQYGLDLTSVEWYTDDTEDVQLSIPDKFNVQRISEDRNIEEMLVSGDLDGAFYPARLSSVKHKKGAEHIFEDPFLEEQRYYEETKHFPLMHTVVIRDTLLEKYPWIATNIYKAFSEARDICLQKLEDPRWTALAWAQEHLDHQQKVLGTNPWPYGLVPSNQRTLDKLLDYAYDQGLTPKKYSPEDLFAKSTLDPEIEGKEYVSGK